MVSKPVELSLRGSMMASLSKISPFGHSTALFLFMVWKLQIKSYTILLVYGMIKTLEIFRSLSTNIFTQHPDDNSSECVKSPSATDELEYTWALRSSSSSTSPCLKHRRTSGGGDNEEDDDRPLKKPKNFLDDDQGKLSKPCFACHFHIYDPMRYSTSAFNTKYRECAGPGWNDLKCLKYASTSYSGR